MSRFLFRIIDTFWLETIGLVAESDAKPGDVDLGVGNVSSFVSLTARELKLKWPGSRDCVISLMILIGTSTSCCREVCEGRCAGWN